jgi:hypothetical protein
MSSRLNKLLILLGVLLIAYGAYYFSIHMNDADELVIQDPGVVGMQGFSQNSEKILSDTKKIRTIVIDDTFFMDKKFTSLVDTQVELIELETGRTNPFAPLE